METTPPKPSNTSVEEKLDEILQTLKKIERQGHKSFWQSGLKFTILNFGKILAFLLLLFLVWKIWGIVDGISASVDFLKDTTLGLLEKLSNSAGSLKFWE